MTKSRITETKRQNDVDIAAPSTPSAFNAEHGYIDADVFSNSRTLREALLNGADNWNQYSYGGCSLIYDGDIAERLCNPSELKKTRNGERNPNSRETWLDVQARALGKASYLIIKASGVPSFRGR